MSLDDHAAAMEKKHPSRGLSIRAGTSTGAGGTAGACLQLATPLGELSVQAGASGKEPALLALSAEAIEASLPPGMSVAACHGVLLQVDALDAPVELVFELRLQASEPLRHAMDTGQGLEALAWQGGRHVLLAGTDDLEGLQARLGARLGRRDDPFSYSAQALSMRVHLRAGPQPCCFHFVVAWNELPEPEEASCWYAVGMAHEAVVQALWGGPSR